MRKRIIAGNWKMFKTASEALAFVNEVKGKAEHEQVESVICAPFTSLPALAEAVQGTTLKLGAQNVHWEEQGAFTGEVSGPMLQHLGVEYVIIGHSERRAYFAETDDIVNNKVHAAFRYGMTPIICVGEKLEEKEAGQTKDVCRTQVKGALQQLTAEQVKQVVIAYEPIWAIGTGRSSTAADANEVIAFIRQEIAALYNEETAAQVRIQYGGSVNPANIGQFLSESDIDGALVGGASLEPESYIQLIQEAAQ